MNAPIKYQTILGADGKPAFVVVPYEDFLQQYDREHHLVPNEIAGMVLKDGMAPMRAWREYLGLTQVQVAARLEISQAAYAQIETSQRPRKSTLRRVASVLGIAFEQLNF